MERICIGSIIRDREWILPAFFNHILNIEYPKEKIDLIFLFNDISDNSLDCVPLASLRDYHSLNLFNLYFGAQPDRRDGKRRQRFKHFAFLRNTLKDYFLLLTKAKYLLSIDSDILVYPKALEILLSQQKDIISALITNDYGRGKYTNALMQIDIGKYKHLDFEQPILQCIPCDVTGACCLIKREVFEKGVHWDYDSWGEDIYFSNQAREMGFNLFTIKGIARHIMGPEMLAQK